MGDMVSTIGMVLATLAMTGGNAAFVADLHDPLRNDVARLAREHRLAPVPVVANERFDQIFGRPVARFESWTLTKAEKDGLWDAFVRTMTRYGKPHGPGCGVATISFASAGVKAPYFGSGWSGGHEFYYFLEETGGPRRTVVLTLHRRPARR
jgi:hypothetical protein